MSMLVSIIVPVYNVADYVGKCLESIANQTYTDYEVIIMEGNSTDGSREIVTRFCENHPKFRPVYQAKPIGLMASWMEAVPLTNADYIAFLDGDDMFESTFLEKLVGKVEKYNVDVAIANFFYDNRLNNKGLTKHIDPIEEGYYSGNDIKLIHSSIFPSSHGHYLSPSRCCKLIRKNIFVDNLKYCDTSISSAEDVNIMVPVMLSAHSVYYLDEPLMYYVKRHDSISHVFRYDTLDMYDKLIKILHKVAYDKNLNYETELKDLYNVYGIHWVSYVSNSNLTYREKNNQLRRLFEDSEYIKATSLIKIKDDMLYQVYKLMLFSHTPCLILWYLSAIKTIKRILR